MRLVSLSSLYEPHGSRIHAIAETGWPRAVIEEMAKMSIALTAGNSRALHPQAHIPYFNDILLGNRLPEAWPASSGFKLGL
jgi:hypothetical protein